MTKDHITPRSIGKALGWSVERRNSPENIQRLSEPCHREKDAITPWELQAVQKNGGAKTIWEHANEHVILKRGMPEEARIKIA